MKKIRIICDFDDVIVDTLGLLVKTWNEENNDNLTKEDIADWNVNLFRPNLASYFESMDIEKLEEKNNSLYWINRLLEDDKYEVYIATASHPRAFVEKCKWIKSNIKNFKDDNIILCRDKSILQGEFMIDDGYHNIETSICKYNLLYTARHNEKSGQEGIDYDLRINSLKEAYYFIKKKEYGALAHI